jgi:hypothetical protein
MGAAADGFITMTSLPVVVAPLARVVASAMLGGASRSSTERWQVGANLALASSIPSDLIRDALPLLYRFHDVDVSDIVMSIKTTRRG